MTQHDQAATVSISEARQPRQPMTTHRQRRHAQQAPQCFQTLECLSNLQSFLVNTAPCFPAADSNQVCTARCVIASRVLRVHLPSPLITSAYQLVNLVVGFDI